MRSTVLPVVFSLFRVECISAHQLPLDTLTSYLISYSATNGILVQPTPETLVPAPLSLLPNVFPRTAFHHGVNIAPLGNTLVDLISRDGEFLRETLQGVDPPFTGRLLEMHERAPNPGDRLGILRSDYMLTESHGLKQIECNTIASSFAGLSTSVAAMHGNMLGRFPPAKSFLEERRKEWGLKGAEGVPKNNALGELTAAMAMAHRRYVERHGVEGKVVFVTQEGERNTVDQRLLEFALWEEHNISVVRMTLGECLAALQQLDNGGLALKDGSEVTLVYYRAGYAPTDYLGENEWQAREILEKARCAKCPDLGYHLVGTKKVQQAIAKRGVLEKWLTPQDAKKMREVFAGLFSLDEENSDEEDRNAVLDALNNSTKYVLKPQREGGGYNFYNEEMGNMLRENVVVQDGRVVLGDKLKEYILMERLFPPTQEAILLRDGKIEGIEDSISEFGCYSTIISDQHGKICHNKYAGFLLRTKFSNVDEGGVASGFATLSSPYLC